MLPCVPTGAFSGRELLLRLIDLHDHGGTEDEWRSLASDLGTHVAQVEVRLHRVRLLEHALNRTMDEVQVGLVRELTEG